VAVSARQGPGGAPPQGVQGRGRQVVPDQVRGRRALIGTEPKLNRCEVFLLLLFLFFAFVWNRTVDWDGSFHFLDFFCLFVCLFFCFSPFTFHLDFSRKQKKKKKKKRNFNRPEREKKKKKTNVDQKNNANH
jgi:Ca2+/Na+ antiporter